MKATSCRFNSCYPHHEKAHFCPIDKSVLFQLYPFPVVTCDIPVGMISASQMIYASRIWERILYHTCKASISYGTAVYHIASAIFHWLYALVGSTPHQNFAVTSFLLSLCKTKIRSRKRTDFLFCILQFLCFIALENRQSRLRI